LAEEKRHELVAKTGQTGLGGETWTLGPDLARAFPGGSRPVLITGVCISGTNV